MRTPPGIQTVGTPPCAGVEFVGDLLDTGFCRQAAFADPDGNRLILHHRYAPKPAA